MPQISGGVIQKDHLLILLESIDSKVQITLEAVLALDKKIDGVEKRLTEKLNQLGARIDAVALDGTAH